MSTSAIHGECAPGFEAVSEAFEANFTAGREVGASFAATRNGEPIVDLWAVMPTRRALAHVGARHHRQRLFDDEGDDGAVRPYARRPRCARRRCAGGALLAGVRPPRQGGDHHAPSAQPQRRPGRAAAQAVQRRVLRLEADGRCAGGRDAVVGAGHRQRLPRPDLRASRWRGDPPHQRRDTGHVFPPSRRRAVAGGSFTSAWPRRKTRARPTWCRHPRPRSPPPGRAPSRIRSRCSAR